MCAYVHVYIQDNFRTRNEKTASRKQKAKHLLDQKVQFKGEGEGGHSNMEAFKLKESELDMFQYNVIYTWYHSCLYTSQMDTSIIHQ